MDADKHIADPLLHHLFDGEDSMNVYSLAVTNLSAGTPGPDLLRKCIDIFIEATNHRLNIERENAYIFQYGITAGMWEFRQHLSAFLTKHYGEPVHRADLILTCGATHGLQLAMGTFLDPRAVIFVEEVTYMIALDAFRQYPLMRVVSVPMKDDGIDADCLLQLGMEEKKKWEFTSNRPFWGMLYTIPLFQNPTGCSMSVNCCKKVVDVARKLDIMVLCDDVYNLLYYGDDARPPKRLFAYDDPIQSHGHVVSNGTFSKFMGPGVRVGWLELPPPLALLMRDSGILRSGGGVNQYMSGVITSILELGLASTHLSSMVDIYKQRMVTLCDTLEQKLPSNCSFKRPQGGYFVWIKLPKSVNGEQFTNWCKEKYKVSAIHGSRFDVHGGHANYLRLSIGFHNPSTLNCAAEKICSALEEYSKEK